MSKVENKFSIFDPVITFKHREFYEQIVNELNVILPVCNHGKSLAVDIGRTAKEQDTIKDLMARVERFRGELLLGTKNLFGQFYQSKEEFYKMIYSTVAYGKINTLDRNLLERTCDVRWWALETAFSECVVDFNRVRRNIDQIISDLQSAAGELSTELHRPIEVVSIIDRLKGSLHKDHRNSKVVKSEALKKISSLIKVLSNKYKPLLNKQSYSETLDLYKDVVAYFLAAKNISLVDFMERTASDIKLLIPKVEFACDRLEGINRSYTLYRNLVLCDEKGNIIACSNRDNKLTVQGTDIHGERWFGEAVKTVDGNEYYAQDISDSSIEEQPSLVYSTAVREQGDINGNVVGALGIFFDFQDESQIILNDHMLCDSTGQIEDGWCSFFSSKDGDVIASSDEYMFEENKRAGIPRSHRNVESGKTHTSYAVVKGTESCIYTAKTDGYLDYRGLAWNSHLIVPKKTIFNSGSQDSSVDVEIDELMNSSVIPSINKKTYRHIQKDKRALQLISTNGMLFAAELGARGQSLGPVFEQITKTGDFATKCMEDLLHEMARDELSLNLKTLEMFSKQAIDLIDRNLFERSADIRWWATDKYFWKALMEPTEENFRKACERLKVINNSYTMYRNLVLANSKGEIVACSKMGQLLQIQATNVADQDWFIRGSQTLCSKEYAVQDVQNSELEKNKDMTLVYSGGVRSDGVRDGEAIGVLGVMFDWDTEAGNMLRCCLPKNRDGDYIEGSAALYTNKDGVIIESTDTEKFPVGSRFALPVQCRAIEEGQSASGLLDHEGQRYIIGSSRTKGYREYRGLEWCAHIIRPF